MAKETSPKKLDQDAKPTCGIIMPISAIAPKYDAAHWSDVRRVLDEAIANAGLTPQIVSDSFESDVIQSRIIHNLYENPMVVCDISGLNPNVMFELGMRLTFNKPVVIVTDDFSSIPFDTKVIEHLGYPTDLHIHKTVEFQKKLTAKIQQILEQVSSGKYKSPLAAFGSFQVFQPTTESVPGDKYVAERIDELFAIVSRLDRRSSLGRNLSPLPPARNAFSDYAPKRRLAVLSENEFPNQMSTDILFLDNVDSVSTVKRGQKYSIEVNFIDNNMPAITRTMAQISKIVGTTAVFELNEVP